MYNSNKEGKTKNYAIVTLLQESMMQQEQIVLLEGQKLR